MTETTEELIELRDRISSIINDIQQDALPNPGKEKEDWIKDLSTVNQMLSDIISSETM